MNIHHLYFISSLYTYGLPVHEDGIFKCDWSCEVMWKF